MTYNKTKRNLEKAAAIVGIIISALAIISSLTAIVNAIEVVALYVSNFGVMDFMGTVTLMEGLVNFGIAIALIILCSKVVASPVKEDGTLAKRKGMRIAILVLSLLSGNFITFGLIIAVLCLKDYPTAHDENQPAEQTNTNAASENVKTKSSIDELIAQVKYLRGQGLLDDEAYKQAIKRIVAKAFK